MRRQQATERIIMVGALCLAACARAGDDVPSPPARAYPPLSSAVAQILNSNPGWHLGTNDDCTNPMLRERLSDNPSFQAYRAHGDIDGDGTDDRVFVVIKGDSGKVYWVPGREDGFDSPRLMAALDWIRDGGVSVQRGGVVFGRFFSDVALGWRWNRDKGTFDVISYNPASN